MPDARASHWQGDPLGDMLKRARLLHNPRLTQQDVAEALNVVQSTVSAWESGKVKPNVVALKQLARLLDEPLEKLIDAAEASVLAAAE